MTNTLLNTEVNLVDFFHSGVSLATTVGTGLSVPKPFSKTILLIKTYVTGMFFVKDVAKLLEPLAEGDRLTLIREPENKYDIHAILVKDVFGNKLGYVPRKNNVVIANLMDAGKLIYAIVREKRRNYSSPDMTINLFMED